MAGAAFETPADASAYRVVERLAGTATTDFGAPGAIPACDLLPVDDGWLGRAEALLEACWQALDAAAVAAAGKQLARGPRGGGRELAAIVGHVAGADAAYLARLGRKASAAPATGVGPGNRRAGASRDEPAQDGEGLAAAGELAGLRQAIRAAVRAAVSDADATAPASTAAAQRGPRGGTLWPPRYFVRRVAWHALDHAWEIEDRAA
jgi:hypothetical protein